VGAPIGEISEVISLKSTLNRLEQGADLFDDIKSVGGVQNYLNNLDKRDSK